MSIPQPPVVGDFGFQVVFAITTDGAPTTLLTDATFVGIEVEKPGSTVLWDAVVLGNPTDGKIAYVTLDGDLDVSGKYRLRPQVSGPGFNYRGSWVYLQVNA